MNTPHKLPTLKPLFSSIQRSISEQISNSPNQKTETPVQDEITTPCTPSPCGANAICREQNNIGACQCLPDYYGNPYDGCRPECVTNSECPNHLACLSNKCKDPCPGVCGQNAECRVINHSPQCYCQTGFVGNPLASCHKEERLPPSKKTHLFENAFKFDSISTGFLLFRNISILDSRNYSIFSIFVEQSILIHPVRVRCFSAPTPELLHKSNSTIFFLLQQQT